MELAFYFEVERVVLIYKKHIKNLCELTDEPTKETLFKRAFFIKEYKNKKSELSVNFILIMIKSV
ncbi:hypothetical protein [Planococcus shixiaomingii]|uniref:hypothetical protein n=1 Tax=Planococcus shixiaomingii TaxID=3058393 RepID=UPI00265A9309|nr:hypothetical protein [Planococcus sp. N028]